MNFLLMSFLFAIIVLMIILLWMGESAQAKKHLQQRLQGISYTKINANDVNKAPLYRQQLEQSVVVFLQKKQQRLVALGGASVVKLLGFLSVVAAASITLLLSKWLSGISLLMIFFSVLILILTAYYLHLERKNLTAFDKLLPQAVELVARASLAGCSVPMAIHQVAEQVADPLGSEFSYIRDQLTIGTELEQALQQSIMRMPLPAYQFFAVTLLLNQDSGGRLAEVMQTLSHTLRIQRKMIQKIQTLTSEPRGAANIVALIPVILFLFMYSVNPDGFNFLLYDASGQKILVYVISSILIGLLIIKLLTKVKV